MTQKTRVRAVWRLTPVLFFVLLAINMPARAQLGAGPTNISNDHINPQNEVAISVDPTNADRRVIVAMSRESGNKIIRAYHTNNGGQSWRSVEVPRPLGWQFRNAQPWSDPSVAHDHEGRVYVAYNLREGGRGNGADGFRDAIVVARYREDVADRAPFYESVAVSSWTDSNVDKPFLEVDDNPESPGAGNVYVAWTDLSPGQIGLYLAKSTDQGATWTQNYIAPNYLGSIHAVDLGIGPRGEVYAVWKRKDTRQLLMKNCGVAGSNPFAVIRTVATTADFIFPAPIPAVGRGDNVMPLPSIDVDRSGGPYHGRVWVAFADYLSHTHPPVLLPPEYMNIYVTWSDDKGASWHAPVKINRDGTLTSQFHPWLDVDDADGSVGVIYYSTEADPVNNKIVHVQYAQFTAGDASDEENWTNRRITNSGSNVDNSTCGTCYREYIGLHKQDYWAYLAWTSLHTGEPEIFAVKILGDR